MFRNLFQQSGKDSAIDKMLKSYRGIEIGRSEDGVLCASSTEVNGFKFLRLELVGPWNIRTQLGAEVIWRTEDSSLEMESDSTEIKSLFSKKLKQGLTHFDVDLDESLMALIQAGSLKSVKLTFKKEEIAFQITQPDALRQIADAAGKEPEVEVDMDAVDYEDVDAEATPES
ncbi:hypothetical protein [Pontibacter sp. G13]|uniref:hypothetical protein n=1 Tax=Pontibacter sp. G13 TaxID=3074898 RepID=UPI00288B4779|nr:hypothetical protein [Pontibacter sp. G13]WNJ19728.1 hypothetical protein RJD25_04530 [Pontibacter sp. G13]